MEPGSRTLVKVILLSKCLFVTIKVTPIWNYCIKFSHASSERIGTLLRMLESRYLESRNDLQKYNKSVLLVSKIVVAVQGQVLVCI